MKILVSYDYGAGWSTWSSGEASKFGLTYQPIIDFIENGGRFTEEDCHKSTVNHPLLKQFLADVKEATDDEYFCILGAADLAVVEVSGTFRVTEYDGYEEVEHGTTGSSWMHEEDFQ